MKEISEGLRPVSNKPFFGQYGKHFQEKIFQGLLIDHKWSMQMVEVMHPDFFELRYLSYLSKKYFAYLIYYTCLFVLCNFQIT